MLEGDAGRRGTAYAAGAAAAALTAYAAVQAAAGGPEGTAGAAALVGAMWLCALFAGRRRSWTERAPSPAAVSGTVLLGIAALLAAFSVLLYLPEVGNPFHDDDPMFVLKAREFAGGARPWEWYFWHRGEQHFRPLVALWWLLGYGLFGQAPAGYHALITLAHGLTGAGVAALDCLLGRRPGRALLAGAIFVAYPIHAGVPAILCSGFDNAFSAALGFWSVTAFLWRRISGGRRALAAAALLWALALLNKESAVAFPILALLLDLALHGGPRLLGRRGEWTLRRHGPAYAVFALVFAAYAPLRVALLGGFAGTAVPGGGLLALLPRAEQVRLALLEQTPRFFLWPLNDEFWNVDPTMVWWGAALWGVLLLRSAARGGVAPAAAAVAALWTAAALLPVYGMFWIASNLVGGRLLYLPAAGAAWLVADALAGSRFGRLGAATAAVFVATLAWANLGNQRPRIEESPTQERFLAQLTALMPEMPDGSRHWFLAPPTGARGVRLFVYPSLLKAAVAVRYPLPRHDRFEVGFLSEFGSPEEAEQSGLDVRALEIGVRDFFWRWDPARERLLRMDDRVRERLAEGGEAGTVASWEIAPDAAAPIALAERAIDTARGVRVVLDADAAGGARWTWRWECDAAEGDCFPGERRFPEGALSLDLTNDLAWRMTTAPVRAELRADGAPGALRAVRVEAPGEGA